MKSRIEKVLHEYLRDLPEAKVVSDLYERGVITFEDAMTEIIQIIRKENRNAL